MHQWNQGNTRFMCRADLDLNDSAAPAIVVEDEYDFGRSSFDDLLSTASDDSQDRSPPPPYPAMPPGAGGGRAGGYLCVCGRGTDPYAQCPRCGHTRYL